MSAREHINAAQGYTADAVCGGSSVGTPLELALLAIAHGLIAVAEVMDADANPAGPIAAAAKVSRAGYTHAPVIRMPQRDQTPKTTSTPADAPAEADQGPTT